MDGGRRGAPARRLGAALMASVLLSGCGEDGPPPVSRSRALSELAAAQREGGPKHAGVSARWAPDVRGLSPRRIGPDTLTPQYRTLVRRCAGCHAVPDPGLHAADEWSGVVSRMRIYTDSAGLLPLTGDQRDALLWILRRHAR